MEELFRSFPVVKIAIPHVKTPHYKKTVISKFVYGIFGV